MTLHVHAAWLPQVAYTAGAILPYPAMVGPTAVATATLRAYHDLLMPDFNPAVKQEPTPETVARMAKRLADAMAAGMRPPAWTDRRLLDAARMMNRGQPFRIKSAGRSVTVPGRAAEAQPGAQPGNTLSWSR